MPELSWFVFSVSRQWWQKARCLIPHTHTHIGFSCFMGTLHKHNWYCSV